MIMRGRQSLSSILQNRYDDSPNNNTVTTVDEFKELREMPFLKARNISQAIVSLLQFFICLIGPNS
jgi:hypothetical protein